MADSDTPVVTALLALPDGGRVLDVPCGDGRLTARLADAGYEAIGVDIAKKELERARGARYIHGDLRELPDIGGPVDGVLSWGNSFGYTTPEDTARSLAGFHRVLRPSGRLVLHTGTVAESLLPGGVEDDDVHEFGGIRATVRHRYDPLRSRQESDYTFEGPDGEVERARAAHHVHTSGELVRMLRAAGFREVDLRSGDGAGSYAVGEGALIAVAVA